MQQIGNTASDINDLSELDTIDELIRKYPDKFTKTQLQWQLRFREQNGLDSAVVKFGKRLYIHRPSFMAWLSGHRGAA